MSEVEKRLLPDGWTFVSLGEIAELQLGKMLSAKAKQGDGSRPYLRNANIRWGRVDLSDLLCMDFAEDEVEKFQLQVGDVLICEGGEPGRASVWRNRMAEVLYQKALHRVRVDRGMLDPDYLVYHLWYEAQSGKLAAYFTGSTIKHFTGQALAKYRVRLPPPNEQKRIVEAVNSQLSRLESGVSILRRTEANLKRYRASVLKAACEGRLVPTEVELARQEGRDYEPAGVLLERIFAERRARWEADELAKPARAGKKPKGHEWKQKYGRPIASDDAISPELPEGWTWITVEQAADPQKNSITDGPFGSNLKTAHYTDVGPRVVRLQNIGDGSFVDEEAHISIDHFQDLKKHEVFAGDLVIAALGNRPPRACIVPTWLGPAIVKADCVRFKSDKRVLLPEYANIVLNAEPSKNRMAEVVHGVGRPRLNLGEIKSIPIPVPPLAEQRRIVEESERRLSLLADLERSVERDLIRADRLRQSILKRAFEGKLVPQDPSDEPASALLERIRAEREPAAPKARKRKPTTTAAR